MASVEPLDMRVELLRGRQAWDFLADTGSQRAWADLLERCPWSTAFQSPEFAVGWYEVYQQQYEPILILAGWPNGPVRGLLCLAHHHQTGELVPVGGRDAEYQGWLALPEDSDAFPREAFRRLRCHLPGTRIVFRYLPPGTPLTWVDSGEHSPACDLESWSKPIARTAEATASLRKKSNRSRLNRLKALGEIRFERILNTEALEEIIGDVALMYDLRQGAQHGAFPFSRDADKARMLTRLLREGILHATAMWSSDSLVSVHLGVREKHEVHLGVIAHSPFYAKHSPGKIHLLLLAQMLSVEGYSILDLTPGGDPYKDRSADDYDEVHLLRVYESPLTRLAAHAVRGMENVARKGLRAMGIEPRNAKLAYQRLRRTKARRVPAVLLSNVRDWLLRDSEFRIYSLVPDRVCRASPTVPVSRDSLADLLRYAPAEGWQTKQAFLSRALARLEDGEHVYTITEGERLLHYGWLREQADKTFSTEVRQELRFPQGSAYLHDFYTFPHARGRGLDQQVLCQILADLGAYPEVKRAFIGVLADNGPTKHVIEKMGFTYEFSGFQRIRFGQTHRWVGGQFRRNLALGDSD